MVVKNLYSTQEDLEKQLKALRERYTHLIVQREKVLMEQEKLNAKQQVINNQLVKIQNDKTSDENELDILQTLGNGFKPRYLQILVMRIFYCFNSTSFNSLLCMLVLCVWLTNTYN